MQQHVHGNEMTAEEAANYLGIEVKALAPLLERYGVGRHYEARHGDEFVYDPEDIEKVKRNLESSTNKGEAPSNEGPPP